MLVQKDIARIGYHVYEINQGTCFRCHLETAGIEEILLTNILCQFGDYYLTNNNVILNNDEKWVEFHTDLPFNVYKNYAQQVKYNPLFNQFYGDLEIGRKLEPKESDQNKSRKK